MTSVTTIQETTPVKILESLKTVKGWALLLATGQSIRPQTLESLAPTEAGLWWVPALPHPDLALEGHGAWLLSAGRPPFGPGRPQDASVWGLLGPAQDLAAALEISLNGLPKGGDWQPALLLELGRRGLQSRPHPEARIVQHALPSFEECLNLERGRAVSFAHLHQAGSTTIAEPPKASGDEIPSDWMEAAIRLAKVPQRTFRNVKLSGLGAGDLLGKLSQFSFEHSFDLAFAEGWHGAAPAAATVSKPLRRVAVVYPAYGGSMNLAQRSAEAAERLGFEVVRIDPSHRREEVRAALRSGGIGEKLYRSLEQECLSGIAEAKPQMLWILAQAFLSTGAIRTLRRQGMLTAYWFCEDYRLYPWRENALAVDAFYALQGGAFPGALRAAGVSVFPPLPACAASDACRLPLPDRPSRPLSFFGYPYRNRLRVFEALADLPLELFGERWDENATPLLKPLVRDASLLNEAQGFELFQQSAVNLNLHSSTVLNGVDPEGDYLNPRTFEIAACGGFQLCDRRLALPASFVDGAEIETFSSVGELREKLGRWMIDSQGRKLVAAAARRRVAAEHTYEHRLATVMQSLGVAVETKI